jgi:hypothetical protein
MSSPTFPSLANINENASVFASMEIYGGVDFSIQVATALMTLPAGATYEVMGSNISLNQADMVDVIGEGNVSGPIGVSTPFLCHDFKYKYLGIAYTTGGGTGTLSFYIEQKLKKVTLIG